MNISGAKKVNFYNQTTDEAISLTKMASGSSYNLQGIPEEDLDGGLVYMEERAEIVIIAMDEGVSTTLATWMRAKDLVTVEVIGLAQVIWWNEPRPLIFDDEFKFAPRQKNYIQIRMSAKGEQLDVNRTPITTLTAGGVPIANFVGIPTGDGVGIIARAIYPATIGDEGSIEWMGETIKTINLISN